MLFADIVDSTETLGRLGDAGWARLRAQHRDVVARALTAYGGREIGSSGDDFFAVFDLPLHALRCAVDLRQQLAALGLQIRVGVHCGEIEISGTDVAGLNVHVTARIMREAAADEVLVSSTVRELVGGAGVGFADRGTRSLRGVPEPWRLHAVEVSTVPMHTDVDGAALPRPPFPAAVAPEAVPLLGRAAELQRLREGWRAAAAGDARTVLLGGEPGGGKTRLLAEFAREVYAAGGTVLWGRCDEGLGVPFQPFVEAIDAVVAHSTPRQLRALLDDSAAELARLVPRIRALLGDVPEPAQSDPGTQQYRLFEAACDVVRRLGNDTPTLLVVDDAHWATVPTLRFLRHLVQRTRPARLMVVMTYRDTAPDLDDALVDWLADLSRLPGVERMVLDGLTEEAVTALVDVLAATAEQPRELARRLHRRTAGNPFFTTQVLRHLCESTTTDDEDRSLPPAIIDVISQRLTRLPAPTRQVLREAAVLGQHFSLDVLAAMLPTLSLQDVLSALDSALEAHLITEDRTARLRYRFTHALVVDAVVDTSPRAWLRDAHLRAASAWESASEMDRDWATAELARHHGAASLDAGKEHAYSRAAGDTAMAALAFHNAVGYYGQALDAAARADVPLIERTELRLALALAEAAAGQASYRSTLEQVWRDALALGDQSLLVRSGLALIRGNFSITAEVDSQRVAVLEAALAGGPVDAATRARLLAQLATELNWAQSQRGRREDLADEALRLSDAIEDLDERLRVIGQCASAVQHPDNLALIFTILDGNEHLLDKMVDPVVALQAVWTWLAYATLRGDPHRIERHVQRFERLADQQPVPLAVYLATWIRLTILFLRGRFDDVLAGCDRLLQLGAALGQDEAGSIVAYYHLLIGHLRGQTADLLPLLEAYADDYREGLPGLQVAVAMFRATIGDDERARQILDELARDDYRVLRQDQATILWLSWAADTAHRTASMPHAAAIYRLLSPYADQTASNGGYMVGSVQHWLGLLADTLGDIRAAGSHFDAAIAHEEALGTSYWVQASRAARAAVAARRGATAPLAELQNLREAALAEGHARLVADIDAVLDGADDVYGTSARVPADDDSAAQRVQI